MKINLDFINKVFNLEINITNQKDKDKLSKYEDYIPMYDIYSQKIYPIAKKNIHHKLIEAHYRFINQEISEWLNNLYNKNINDLVLSKKYKYNLEIISNYNLEILIETSYRTLYKYSPELGLSVSICKRNSFNPYIQHLKPYYTKLELIKLGQNMNIIKKDIDPESLIDQDTHYSICKQVSNNDISFEDIRLHHEHILKFKIESWICFYSFTGSFLFNQYLRNLSVKSQRNIISNNESLSLNYYQGLYKIVKCIEQSPELSNDYDIYRFIWDDSFISNLNEGDIFIDRGFMSTTRDPFYSPGINGTFGLILLKIKIPKNKKGLGIFIENFSLFPKEEEFLIPPYSKIKLISKNNNFKYYHINPQFEKLINRKYEFELIDVNYSKFKIAQFMLKDFKKYPTLYQVKKDKLNKETTDFYKRDVWRKMKFRQYSYGKKSIDTFLNKIKETFGENILIGYGNWSRSSQMKHFMPTMNKGLRKLIHKKYDTITINECNTSKKCCDCNNDLEYYKDKEGKKVFRLLVCSNCVSCENKNIVFRTRDANSSINIMKLTSCWIKKQERPLCFQISSFTSSSKNKEDEKVRPS
jgi:hypothetical protein